ncbi:hypothetical protein QBC34DRAFT_174660 [Podospora aff. communis PSN243]|uniref:Uncharacterized protein n=1 Tax=Podospora aff. communis PSN243 TaxID=3040156 RepID=A0AAV9H380_9PEZI|nr:hypothetical protein QBC34DRAFT_174660 [Podospora aff. communis PSN243]
MTGVQCEGGGRSRRAEGLAQVSNAGPQRGRRVEVGIGLPRTRGVCVGGYGEEQGMPRCCGNPSRSRASLSRRGGGTWGRKRRRRTASGVCTLHSAQQEEYLLVCTWFCCRAARKRAGGRAELVAVAVAVVAGCVWAAVLRCCVRCCVCGAGAERGGESGQMGMGVMGVEAATRESGRPRVVDGSLDGTKPRGPRCVSGGCVRYTTSPVPYRVPQAPAGPGFSCPGLEKTPFSCYAVPFRSPIELCRRPGATERRNQACEP